MRMYDGGESSCRIRKVAWVSDAMYRALIDPENAQELVVSALVLTNFVLEPSSEIDAFEEYRKVVFLIEDTAGCAVDVSVFTCLDQPNIQFPVSTDLFIQSVEVHEKFCEAKAITLPFAGQGQV